VGDGRVGREGERKSIGAGLAMCSERLS